MKKSEFQQELQDLQERQLSRHKVNIQNQIMDWV